MPGTLLIIWDYDTALGQINSTMPYNFSYKPIYEEIENVEYILEQAGHFGIGMTFACVGFVAEEGIFRSTIPSRSERYIHSGMRLHHTHGSMNGSLYH